MGAQLVGALHKPPDLLFQSPVASSIHKRPRIWFFVPSSSLMEHHRSISTPPRLSTTSNRLSISSRKLSVWSRLSTTGGYGCRGYDDYLKPGYQRDTISSLAKQSPRKVFGFPTMEERIRSLEAEIDFLRDRGRFLATVVMKEKHDL